MALVLGIETSCDDTSLCLLEGAAGQWQQLPQVHFLQSFDQDQELRKFGGVVPELAARNHLHKLGPLLRQVFKASGLSLKDLDLIAVTTRPGLLGPLLTGLSYAKTLSLWGEIPLYGAHHLQAHLEAIHLVQAQSYPYLGMLASGGHSAFYVVHGPDHFELLGSTLDDAAGEAFDKGGKLMGLGYPAGRMIDQLAQDGDPLKFSFPIGLKDENNCSMSFSGLKTALRNFLEKNPNITSSAELKDLCASYQHAIVQALLLKLRWAWKSTGARWPIVIGGGVACNQGLRMALEKSQLPVHFVPAKLCTDNAAMIAALGLRHFSQALPFPQCLNLEASAQVLQKNHLGQVHEK